MKQNVVLTITSLLLILLVTFHMTQDALRDEGGLASYLVVTVPVLVLWLYGALVLAGRRSGYLIILVESLLALGLPVIHVTGAGNVLAKTHGAFFVWTLFALGVTSVFSVILSVRGLWSLRRGQPQ